MTAQDYVASLRWPENVKQDSKVVLWKDTVDRLILEAWEAGFLESRRQLREKVDPPDFFGGIFK